MPARDARQRGRDHGAHGNRGVSHKVTEVSVPGRDGRQRLKEAPDRVRDKAEEEVLVKMLGRKA